MTDFQSEQLDNLQEQGSNPRPQAQKNTDYTTVPLLYVFLYIYFVSFEQSVLEDVISSASDYIAPDVFNLITTAVVGCSLFVGILVPKSMFLLLFLFNFLKYPQLKMCSSLCDNNKNLIS